MANPTGKGGFQERKHQINRKGRPRSFDALRELAQQIGHEVVEVQRKDKDGRTTSVETYSMTEAILRSWAQSKDPRLQMAFIEIAYGKVPQRTEVSGPDGGPVATKVSIVEVVKDSGGEE